MARSAENQDDKSGSFDLEKFRKLLQLMEKYGVTEANLQNDRESWKVRRGPRSIKYGAPVPEFFSAPVTPGPSGTFGAGGATFSSGPPAASEKPVGVTINAPTVGTFYTAASPEDPPFVSVGSVVRPDTVVCIIEAMKVFNQIQAEKSGRVTEMLVENGAAVEYGQPLFRVEPVHESA